MSWPYEDPPEQELQVDKPTWLCPGGQCQCHAMKEDAPEEEMSIVLCAHDGERMPGAVCRVHHAGQAVHDGVLTADGDGRVTLTVPRLPTSMLIEWAPSDTPKEPRYPYRTRYFVELGESERQAGRRRLANLGFYKGRTLEENVREFQARYGHAEQTGNLDDIHAELIQYHDTGSPPITHEHDPGPGPSLDDVKSKDASSLSFAPAKAKQGPSDKAPPSGQPPLSPAPNQGTAKVPSPAVEVDLLIDWGRGGAGASGTPSSSFWLNPTAVPVAVGIVDTLADQWATMTPIDVPVTRPTSTSAL
ncbi:MAG: peptidoglycan-binding domain-containing protein, partial [Polyangiaceae bacterium]